MSGYDRSVDYFKQQAGDKDAHETYREYHSRLDKWSRETGWRAASQTGRDAGIKLGLDKFAIDHSLYLYHPERGLLGVLTEPYAGTLSMEVLREMLQSADRLGASIEFVQGHAFWNPLDCIPILTSVRAKSIE